MLSCTFHPIAFVLVFFTSLLIAAQSNAQVAPPPAATDALQDAAKRAFEALPEAERIGVQDSLIWTGDFNGVAAGKFGRATRDAIIAFASRNKLPNDGTLDAKGRALLFAAGKQAKDAARFTLKTDEPTGMRIGLPLKILSKAKPSVSGTRYSNADDSFALETSATAAAPNTLQDSFNSLVAAPDRKVTYKILRADFFVIAGEQGKTTFYIRMAQGTRAGHPSLVGITLSYPSAAKSRYDPLLIAISNAFVPFPDPNSPELATSIGPLSTATPQPAATGPRRVLAASGIAVGPGFWLTSLPQSCADPQVGGKTAKILRQSEADGLTLLSAAEPNDKAGADKAVTLRNGDPADITQVVVLSFSQAKTQDELVGASGTLQKTGSMGAWKLRAPLQNPVAGSAIFDSSGALLGLGVGEGPEKTVAGLLPQRNRPIVPAVKLAAFLADARPKPASDTTIRTAGEVAALNRASLSAVTCLQ